MRYLIAESSWSTVALAKHLDEAGMLLSRTDRPEDLSHFLATAGADLLVVDAALFVGGMSRLRALRTGHPGLPIAVLADTGAQDGVAALLGAGADTVIDRTTTPAEMAARLMAVARRARGLASSRLDYGRLAIDLATRQATLDGQTLQLTPKVYEMLEYMALRPGILVTRDALLSHVYGLEDEPESRVFDVYMCTLRSRLRPAADDISIQTARGEGFRFLAGADGTRRAA